MADNDEIVRPESSPEYVAHCTESFLGAMSEAQLLLLDRDADGRLAETLHFASDLLDIIENAVDGLTSDPHAADVMKSLRGELNALRALLPSAS